MKCKLTLVSSKMHTLKLALHEKMAFILHFGCIDSLTKKFGSWWMLT